MNNTTDKETISIYGSLDDEIVPWAYFDGIFEHLQRSPLFCAPGLVKFVPAVARLFCLALPVSFLTMFCAE